MSSTPLPKKPVLGLLLKDLIYNKLVTTYLIPIKKVTACYIHGTLSYNCQAI